MSPGLNSPAPAMDRESILGYLGGASDEVLFTEAAGALKRNIGTGVFLRGLIELSNVCRKNCSYCGLRRDNRSVKRYTMAMDQVVSVIEHGYSRGLRSFLLQSGELPDTGYIELVLEILRWVHGRYPSVRMVLSMGELPEDVFDLLLRAGAHRYLLRIESSSGDLYSQYHPDDGMHSHTDRLSSIESLRRTGWQTGTGVLIGLPDQTLDNLADDLAFMREMDIDMCGMGPYLPHEDTPLWRDRARLLPKSERVDLTLRMIALLRVLMPTVNVAATTALQTLDPMGLERGLAAGANVIMPNLTPEQYRREYNLYQGKILVEDSLDQILEKLSVRCGSIGRKLVLGSSGDPLHFLSRTDTEGASGRNE